MFLFELALLVVFWLLWRSEAKDNARVIKNISERLQRLEQRLGALESPPSDQMAVANSTTIQPAAIARETAGNTEHSAISVSPSSTASDAPNVFPPDQGDDGKAPAAEPLLSRPLVKPSATTVQPAPAATAIPKRETAWQHIEKIFIENWTGILGAAIVVAGVTFLGIYTALRFTPFYRFLMTLAIAGGLAGASWYLRRRESWLALAQWVRSAAAAIFLFACAASGGLPGLGLQWIDSPSAALAMLLLGMAANLYLAWIARTQQFAALHVILGLLPLTIVPQSAVTLGIASAVALFGVLLSYRERWDQHLLGVLAAYLVHQVAWYLRLQEAMVSRQLRYVGILCAFAVLLPAALAHYRKIYASSAKAEALPLLVHLSSWALLALAALVYHPNEGIVRAIVLALGGVAAYLLARRAQPLGIRWLYLSDTLIGQTMMLAAILSLAPLIADTQIVLLVLFLESLMFLRLVIGETEELPGTVGWCAAIMVGLIFAVSCIPLATFSNQSAFIMLASAAATLAAHLHLTRRYLPRLSALGGDAADAMTRTITVGALGWLACLMVMVGLLNLMPGDWMEVTALAAGTALLLLVRMRASPGLMTGSGAVVGAAHLTSWANFLQHQPWTPASLALHIVPLGALAGCTIGLAGAGLLRQFAIYLLGLDAGLAAYLLFAPVSPLIPGVAWLLLSVGALELANRLERPSTQSVLLLGYCYLVSFIGAYAFVIIQSQAYLGIVPARLLIELFGLGVLLYWWFSRPRAELAEHPAWLQVHPWFIELALIAAAAINIVEVQDQWRPLTWSLLSFVSLARPLLRHFDERLQMYSLAFYWASVADVAIVMSTFESPSPKWYDRPDITSIIAVLLQTGYLVLSHRRLTFAGLHFPQGLGALDNFGKRIIARRNYWVYYPFFAGVAMFLFWRFDHSVLTLLWAAEAFTVFGLSALLRENQFRHVALAGLGACLFRLVFIDMSEANLGMRGLVFLGVGLLMLGMNAIYSRFRARFQ